MSVYIDFDDEKKAKREFERRTKENQDGWKTATSIGDTQSANDYHDKQKKNVEEWDDYTGGISTYDEDTGAWNYSIPFSEKPAKERYREREFEYDINSDPLFKQYLASAKRNGEKAMTDTIARAAAQTGGVAGSYAVAAGAQSYNDYMQSVNDVIPQLEQLAYQRYNDELDRDLKIYEMDEEQRWEDANTATIAQEYQDTGKPLTQEQKTAWNASGGWIDGDVLVDAMGNRYNPGTKYAKDKEGRAYYNYVNVGWNDLDYEDQQALLEAGYQFDEGKNMLYNPSKWEYYKWEGTGKIAPKMTIAREYQDTGKPLTQEQKNVWYKSGGWIDGDVLVDANGNRYKPGTEYADERAQRAYDNYYLKGWEGITEEDRDELRKKYGYDHENDMIYNTETGEHYSHKGIKLQNEKEQSVYDKYAESGWNSLSKAEQDVLRKMGYEYDSARGMIGDGIMYYSWGKGEPILNVIDAYIKGEDISYAEDLLKENGYVYLEGTLYDSKGNSVAKNYDEIWNEAMREFQANGYNGLSELHKAVIDYYGHYDDKKNWVYRGDKAYATNHKQR